jgi:serine/threonine protein phosphatase PrpC
MYFQINDRLSGTTAVTACFHGGRLTVCNVGDSRVILGHRIAVDVDGAPVEETKEEEKVEEAEEAKQKNLGKLVAVPLTRDQTCYRLDERERVLKMGGEIKSIDQLEGTSAIHDNWGDFIHGEQVNIHGDPPRVWVPGKKYPGCAFTRSFGDSMGEEIGITACPEIVTCDITTRDEILVVASDGVFEFLTNQEVIDICDSCKSPLEASGAVTKAAYRRWIEHDSRCDDITVIVCFLTSTYEPPEDLVPSSTVALVENLSNVYGSAPTKTPSTLHPAQKLKETEAYNRKASEIYATRGCVSGSLSETSGRAS